MPLPSRDGCEVKEVTLMGQSQDLFPFNPLKLKNHFL